MADFFISYTSSDSPWASWIGHELEALGHQPYIHEWQVAGGDNIMAWMEEKHDKADHVLCIVSKAYLTKPYSTLERQAAQWDAITGRRNLLLPVFIEACEPPRLFAPLKRCELFDLAEDDARARLKTFLEPPTKPPPGPFPGNLKPKPAVVPLPQAEPAPHFPGKEKPFNIPIRVPTHFLGRDDALAAIEAALSRYKGRAAITALHGLRGVGKTTLAAAYAERHRDDYRATWWIRAQTQSSMRADLVSLGARLGWVGAEDKEEVALSAVLDRLRHEGDDILLIYDNAIDAKAIEPFLPRGGAAHVLVTSNADTFRGVAALVEIRLWPKAIGADYLIARTGRATEHQAAEALSEALGGLPLAHEQAAAYCERLAISLGEYSKRFAATPEWGLDHWRDAPAQYHDGLTVAKTFGLAIEEAANLHPAAEPLIAYAAQLAPEPIPLFLFEEAREKFGAPLASALAGDGLDEAVAALRTFALIDREPIADEREPEIVTDTIRLHRLVREVAAARRKGAGLKKMRRTLIRALAAVYPKEVFSDPTTWPRVRRLDRLTLALIDVDSEALKGTEERGADMLHEIAAYSHAALGDYPRAKRCFERALAMYEKVLGSEHPRMARTLNSLALHLQVEGNYAEARRFSEQALAIYEKQCGPEHADTAWALNSLGRLYRDMGDFDRARALFERALAIREDKLGPGHPHTATSLGDLARLLHYQGDLAGALPPCKRAMTIYEAVLSPDHPHLAWALIALGRVYQDMGDLSAARPLFERALSIRKSRLGDEHPDTATSLSDLSRLLHDERDLAAARPLCERALAIREKALGPEHRYTATSLNDLARLLLDQGETGRALPLLKRALAIDEKALGAEHPTTNYVRRNLAHLLLVNSQPSEALALGNAALAAHERALGQNHAWTKGSARVASDALNKLGRAAEAAALRDRYGINRDGPGR